MLRREQLHNYQVRGVKHIIEHPNAALFLDMGLGKTVTTLTAIADMLSYFEISKALIVAPKRVAEVTWKDEVANWEHLHNLRISVIKGTAKKRLIAAKADADIYVVSRDNLVWLLDAFGGAKLPYDMLVIDELSSMKNQQSNRFRAARKIRRYTSRVVGLTGTPAPNGLIDLWAQMFIIDGGERLGKSITDYRANYFIPGARNGDIVYKYNPRNGSDTAIADRIADITLSMKAEDYLDMPALNSIIDYVELSDSEMRAYKEFEKEQVLTLIDAMQQGGDGTNILALSASALSNKLLQYAGGQIYDADKMVHDVHTAKLEKLEEIIEAANEQPVLVAYNFRHELERLMHHFRKLNPVKLETEQNMRDWNAGKIKLLITHPASAGHGLNLQKGGNNLVWYGNNWSLELYQQFNARLWRQGQTKPVFIRHIVAKGTIDEKVISSLTGKADTQNGLMSMVKELVNKYKH